MHRGPFWKNLETIRHLPQPERRAAFSNLKEEVNTNEELAAEVVELLWNECSKSQPWPQPSYLREIVEAFDLPDALRAEFITAINVYASRTRRIEQIAASVLSPNALYRACFGFAPTGRVKILFSSPITITFLLFSEDDYARAYASGETADSDQYNEKKNQSKASAACAFSRTLIPQADHIFTAVKIPEKNQRLVPSHERETSIISIQPDRRAIEHRVCSIEFYDWIRATITVHRPNGKTGDDILRISKGDSTPCDTVMTFDGQEMGYEWKRVQRPDHELVITHRDGRPGKIVVQFDLEKDQVSIRNRTSQPFDIESTRLAFIPDLISPDLIQQEIAHEVQHQWNKLFLPKRESPVSFATTIATIVDRSEDNPERGQYETLMATLAMDAASVRSGAQTLRAEARAWDELLSYHRDGTSPEATRATLKRELYNYFGRQDIKNLTALAQRHLNTYLDLYQGTYQVARPVSLSASEIARVIQGLKAEYVRAVDQGVWALTLLQKNQFTPSEIIAHLSKVSLQEWPSVAIRAVKRKRLREDITATE